DEPTTGLDPSQIAETRSLIRELAGNRTMLLVSHILPEVQRTCDRIIIFARGLVRADGPPEALIAGSRSGARCILEVQAPEGAGLDQRLRTLPGATSVTALDAGRGMRRFQLDFKSGVDDPRLAVGEACRDAGATVRELRLDAPSLEEFYIRTVEAADRVEAASGAKGGGS
ncbi:MAG: hypothetical protein KDA21_04865, partial [Phycisphaerales bacterium]|nr:hypothetical protein [Phycisphaerales bacterium]